jgi:hypothetical protein
MPATYKTTISYFPHGYNCACRAFSSMTSPRWTATATRGRELTSLRAYPEAVTYGFGSVKAARVILQITATEDPPLHLLVGSDAVEGVERADRANTQSDQKWRSLSLSTDFDT